jgi:hypothetical protein
MAWLKDLGDREDCIPAMSFDLAGEAVGKFIPT